MKLKLAILAFMVLFTIVILPGGYSFWDEKLSIQGTILIDTPVEVITGPAILDESMLENTELQFEPALLDTDSDLTGGITDGTGNDGEGAPIVPDGGSTTADDDDISTDDGAEGSNTVDPGDTTNENVGDSTTENDGDGTTENDGDSTTDNDGDSTPTESNGNNVEGNITE